MTFFMELMEVLLHHAVEIAILCFNFIGFFMIVLAGVRGVIDYIKKDRYIRLRLDHNMAMGLQFLMGSEILHTIVADSLADISVVAALFAARVGLALMIHWELKTEKKEEEEEEEKEEKRKHKAEEMEHGSEHVAEEA